MVTLELPWPPSLNRYYRCVGRRVLISREGRRYRREVVARLAALRLRPMQGELAVRVRLHPPDRRRRDCDNLQKCVFDAMQHGGVYVDDSQITKFQVEMCAVAKDGRVVVEIEERT